MKSRRFPLNWLSISRKKNKDEAKKRRQRDAGKSS